MQKLDYDLAEIYGYEVKRLNEQANINPKSRALPRAFTEQGIYMLATVLRGELAEQAYHCGASSKDAGKKLCAINVILETSMIHPVIDKLLLAPDKQI